MVFKAKYNEIYDIGTRNGKMTIVGFHSPTGDKPHKMLKGLFDQFRFFKYCGCKVSVQSLQPLPVDPLQVGFEAGEQIDPTAMANPIVFKGCHGENIGDVLNEMMKDSGFNFAGTSLDIEDDSASATDKVLDFYYATLSDPKFKKFMPQSSFRLKLYPLVHKAATLRPILPTTSGYGVNVGKFLPNVVEDSNEEFVTNVAFDNGELGILHTNLTKAVDQQDHDHTIPAGKFNERLVLTKSPVEVSGQGCGVSLPNSDVHAILEANELASNQLFTAGMRKLPWLPTRVPTPTDSADNILKWGVQPVALPKLMMGVLMLPPAFSDAYNFFYRVYIQHTFLFKGFTTSLMTKISDIDDSRDYHDVLERSNAPPSIDSNGNVKLVNAGVQ